MSANKIIEYHGPVSGISPEAAGCIQAEIDKGCFNVVDPDATLHLWSQSGRTEARFGPFRLCIEPSGGTTLMVGC